MKPVLENERKFLVVSFDSHENQWFFDVVLADGKKEAEKFVTARRKYVDGATATSLAELKTITRDALKQPSHLTQKEFDSATIDSGIAVSQCQNCLRRWDETQLDAIDNYHERVAPGEEAPSGECPVCGALCHLEKK